MTTTLDQSTPDTQRRDSFERLMGTLDANLGIAPKRRAAHAKGVVLTNHFTSSPEAAGVTRAAHLSGGRVPVGARFSNFPGGASTDLLAHAINGFPGRVVEDFADFLGAIAPGGPLGRSQGHRPEYLAWQVVMKSSRVTQAKQWHVGNWFKFH